MFKIARPHVVRIPWAFSALGDLPLWLALLAEPFRLWRLPGAPLR